MKKSLGKKIFIIIILSFMFMTINLISKPANAFLGTVSYASSSERETYSDTEKENTEAVMEIIKNAAAKWYYILRLMMIAFMLLVLIFIGIKTLVSTVSQQKAMYKRMLADWLVGMILIMTMHYVMIIIFNINDGIVDSLWDYYTNRDSVELEEYEYGESYDPKQKQTGDLEETLYSSARTRAYSLKATDGFMGLIIYGALVWYAWRFALIYFKRMLNVMLLTVVSPIVAGTYAINKVVTGSARIFSTWLREFILNVTLQTIHALLYVSYVQIAYEVAMTSLPGIILAFVLMHFMTKAEKLIREIFNFSGNLGEEMAGSNFKSMKEDIIASMLVTKGSMAYQAAKAMYQTPVNIAGRGVSGAFGLAMTARANSKSYQAQKQAEAEVEKEEFEAATNTDELDEALKVKKAVEATQAEVAQKQAQIQAEIKDKEQEKAILYNEGYTDNSDEIKEIQEALDNLYEDNKKQKEEQERIKKQLSEAKNKVNIKQKDLDKRKEEYLKRKRYLDQETIGKNIKDIFNPDNYVVYNGKKRKFTARKELVYDPKTKKYKYKGVYDILKEKKKLSNVLGIDKKDNEQLKKTIKNAKGKITGTMAGIGGLALLGAEPAIAAVLISKGIGSYVESSNRRRRNKQLINPETGEHYKGADTLVAGELQAMHFNNYNKNKKYTKTSKLNFHTRLGLKAKSSYKATYSIYEDNVRESTHKKSSTNLYMASRMGAMRDRITETDKSYVILEKKDADEQFIDTLEKIDEEKITHEEKVVKYKEAVSQNKEELIKTEIKKMFTEKGLTDTEKIDGYNLTETDNMTVKMGVMNKLTGAGFVKKGEVELKDLGITNQDIANVKKSMINEPEKTNQEMQEAVVQDTIMNYIKTTGSATITEEGKEEIQKKVAEKVLPKETQKTINVLDVLNQQKSSMQNVGQIFETSTPITEDQKDINTEVIEEAKNSAETLSDNSKEAQVVNIAMSLKNIKVLIDDNTKNIKRVPKKGTIKIDANFDRDVLEQRAITGETNRTKDVLEEAIYTGTLTETFTEDEELGVDNELLETLFAELQIAAQENLEVAELKGSKASKKDKEKYLYYSEKSDERRKVFQDGSFGGEVVIPDMDISSQDGNFGGVVGSTGDNVAQDGSFGGKVEPKENIEQTDKKIYGPVTDIISLINNIGEE